MNIFELFDESFQWLEGYLGTERTRAFLERRYTDAVPDEWKRLVRGHRELLADDSRLYDVLRRIGVDDVEQMVTPAYRLFYLRFVAAKIV